MRRLHWRAGLRALLGISPVWSADWSRGYRAGFTAGKQQGEIVVAMRRLRGEQ